MFRSIAGVMEVDVINDRFNCNISELFMGRMAYGDGVSGKSRRVLEPMITTASLEATGRGSL